MALMHHNGLRVNAPAPESDEVMDIWRKQGWASGAHKDTDPDDVAGGAAVPRVLPLVEDTPDAESTPTSTPTSTRTRPRKATSKKAS